MTVEQLVLSCRNELEEVWLFNQSGKRLVSGDKHDGDVKEYFDYLVVYFYLEKTTSHFGTIYYDLKITLEV